jgi:hypothetical protein
MNDIRLRMTLDNDYSNALGRAVYVFATLEWNIVWCAERLQPGFLKKIRGLTAGQIGTAFISVVTSIHDNALQSEIMPLALRFQDLVRRRNSLLHGKPCTAQDGLQRLFAEAVGVFHLSDIHSMADDFASCSIELNRLLHGPLRA